MNFKLAWFVFSLVVDLFQYIYSQLKFILDLNMSTRFTEVCHVILCLSMCGICQKGTVSIDLLIEIID